MTASTELRSPLDGAVLLDGPLLRIAELPYLRKTNVRITSPDLPTVPNTMSRYRDGTALWLGPDEWLVVGADAQGVDVSAQYTTIVLTGPAVLDVLAHGCALDLERFGPGTCAQTMLARANVILAALSADEMRIHVRASFARYLAAWLLDAAQELSQDPS